MGAVAAHPGPSVVLRAKAALAVHRRRPARRDGSTTLDPTRPPRARRRPIRTKTDGRIYNAFGDEGDEAAVDFDDFATSRPEDESSRLDDEASRPEDNSKSEDE